MEEAICPVSDSKERFSARVDTYKAYRPSYPDPLVNLFYDPDQIGLKDHHKVADVGSGTGISSALLLSRGSFVYGVEPNAEMRKAGEDYLKEYLDSGKFVSVPGSAEETTLPNHSVDLIIAGQAFHWFRPKETREEWLRILKPTSESGLKANVALFWNQRQTTDDPFLVKYEALLHKYCPDYPKVDHRNVTAKEGVDVFFKNGHQLQTFASEQEGDLASLLGRTQSSSYCPMEGHPNHEPLMNELAALFKEFVAPNGLVKIIYSTALFYGTL